MKRILAVLIALCAVTVPLGALAEGNVQGDENLIYNGDFTGFSQAAALPEGWEFDAYLNDGYASQASLEWTEEAGYCIGISSVELNDARVCQEVAVEPGRVYRLSAMIRTEDILGSRGATVGVDNYALDGTYCYSPDVVDTSPWTETELYFRTGAEQTSVTVALRLGGYGTTAQGYAWFAQVSMCEYDDLDGAVVPVELSSQNGAGGTARPPEKAETPSHTMFTVMLLGCAAGMTLFMLLYWCQLRSQENTLLGDTKPVYCLWATLGLALIMRLICSIVFVGHSTDINCFMAWGNAVNSLGCGKFYTSGMFADYPPGYMYICGALAALGNALGLSYGGAGYVFLFKLPGTMADLVLAYLVWRIACKNGLSERFGLLLAGIVALNPALAFVSGGWGQIDSLLTLLVVGSMLLLMEDKRVLSGALYGLAILMKPQALMFGPLMAVAFLAFLMDPEQRRRWKKPALKTLLAVLAAVGVIFVLSLPFQGEQPWDWIIEKYRTTAGSYPYASIEAFNFPSLLGGNWKSVETSQFGRIYQAVGTVMIALAVASAGFFYICGRGKNRGTLFLTSAYMIAAIFTFGHFMHERYLLPAIVLTVLAYLYYRDRRLLLSFGMLTFSVLLNALAAMYIVDHQAARGAYYDVLTRLGSAFELLSFLWLAYATFQLTVRQRALPPLPAKARGEEPHTRIRTIETGEKALPWTKRDRLLLWPLIAVYGAVALTNLGTLKSPESYWHCASVGQTVEVAFDGEYQVREIWIHGNIDTGGTLLIRAGDFESSYDQTYDEMFRWSVMEAGFTGSGASVSLYAGDVKINEIAFISEEGSLIPASVTGREGAALLDEQDTVPDSPSYFNGMYFDELYHGRTAYEHLHGLKPYENSHPPLGKLIIALGVAAFGMNPFGWRISGALIGIAMLPVLYALARRILRSREYAFVATALFAFDFMHFTQTRIATIDVYAVFFVLLMYYWMYRYITMNFFVDGVKKTLKPLGLAGLFFGLGGASKWTCFYAGAGLAVLLFGSLIARYREYAFAMRSGDRAKIAQVRGYWRYALETLLWCCVFYLAVPFAIYFASYLPYYRYEAGVGGGGSLRQAWDTFWNYQDFIYSYHSGLDATHPYQSAWYQWPFTNRPMWYYFDSNPPAGKVSTMTASGNPAVWWISSVGAVTLAALRGMGRVKPDKGLQILCVGVLANFLPWVLVSRCTFIYHFFATVPFILLSAVYLLRQWEERDGRVAWVKWAWLGAAVLLFILLYPGLSGFPVDAGWAAFIKNLPGGALMYGA